MASIINDNSFFKELIYKSKEEIYLISNEGIIQFINRESDSILVQNCSTYIDKSFISLPVILEAHKSIITSNVQFIEVLKNESELYIYLKNNTKTKYKAVSSIYNSPNGENLYMLRICKMQPIQTEKEMFETLYHLNPHMYFCLSIDGIILSVNKAGAEHLGYTIDELVGQSSDILYSLEDIETIKQYVNKCIENPQKNFTFQVPKRTKDNQIIWVEENIQAITYPDDSMAILVFCTDITDIKNTKLQLKQNEENLISLIESLPDAVFFKDAEGRWLLINEIAKKIFRLDNVNWLNKTDLELAKLNPKMKDIHLFCYESDKEAWKNGTLTRSEEIIPDKNKNLQYFDTRKVPLYNPDDSRKGLLVVGRENTDWKIAEEQQRLNYYIQEQFIKALNISIEDISLKECLDKILQLVVEVPFINFKKQGLIYLVDHDSNMLQLTSQLNIPEDLQNSFSAFPFDSNKSDKTSIQTVESFKKLCNDLPIQELLNNGIEDHSSFLNVPILSQKGIEGLLIISLEHSKKHFKNEMHFLDGIASIVSGLIARKKAEAEKIASLKFLENLGKITQIIQVSSDLEKLGEDVLQAMLDIFDCDRAYLLYPCDPNAETWSVPIEKTKPEYPGAFEIGGEFPMNTEVKQVSELLLNTKGALIFNPDKMSSFKELAQNFNIKSALNIAIYPRQGKPWQLGLHQCSHDRIWTNEDKKLIEEISLRFADGLSSLIFLRELKESENKYRSLIENARDIIVSYQLNGNIIHMNKIGLEFFGLQEESYINRNIFEFIAEDAKEDIKTKLYEREQGYTQSRLLETKLLNKDGDVLPFEINSTPNIASGKITSLTSIIRNISDRKQTEEKLIAQNNELIKINSELDRFVYSTSHDLRAPLLSILSLITLSEDHLQGNTELESYLDMMKTSVHKLDTVIREIIDYSRNSRMGLIDEEVDIAEILNNTIESIKFMNGLKEITFNIDIDTKTPFISDRLRVTNLINNLVTNAAKYQKENEKNKYINFHFSCDQNQGMIKVEDNGEGISKEKQSKIFDMFFRNSTKSVGSGLGLYITKEIVEKMGGTIELVSEEGKGSIFTIYLPNKSEIN